MFNMMLFFAAVPILGDRCAGLARCGPRRAGFSDVSGQIVGLIFQAAQVDVSNHVEWNLELH